MFVRYQTVRNIVLVLAGLGLAIGLGVWIVSDPDPAPRSDERPAAQAETETETAKSPVLTQSSAPPVPTRSSAPPVPSSDAAPTALPPHDELVQTFLERRATSDKIKDLNGGRGAKINVYDDDRDGQWDRAKIDVDRDENDDEKWTFKDGRLERRVMADDRRLVYDPATRTWSAK